MINKKQLCELLLDVGVITHIKNKPTDFMLGFLDTEHFERMQERLHTTFSMNIEQEIEEYEDVLDTEWIFLLYYDEEIKSLTYKQLTTFFRRKNGYLIKQYLTMCHHHLKYEEPIGILSYALSNGRTLKGYSNFGEQLYMYLGLNLIEHREELRNLLGKDFHYEHITMNGCDLQENNTTLSNKDPILVHLGGFTTTLTSLRNDCPLVQLLADNYKQTYKELMKEEIKYEKL